MTTFSETAVTLLMADAGGRVIIPPTLAPTVDFGENSDAVLSVFPDSAELVAEAMQAGQPTILDWIGPSLTAIDLQSATGMTWQIEGDDTGWFYSDVPTFRQVAEAIRTIPQVHDDLNNPEIDLDTILFLLAQAGHSVGTAKVTVDFEREGITDAEELTWTYRYVTTPL